MEDVVYVLISPSGKMYFGQTKDWDWRWKGHCRAAIKGVQNHLYNAMRKYGPESFEKIILVENASQELRDFLEILCISMFQTTNAEYGYNRTRGGEGFRAHHSEESRRKIGIASIGRKLSRKHRRALRLANLGKIHSAEHREKNRLARIGKPIHSQEWKQTLSERMKNRKVSEATRAAISRAHKGKKLSSGQIAKLRLSHLGVRRSKEAKEAVSRGLKRAYAEGRRAYIGDKISRTHKERGVKFSMAALEKSAQKRRGGKYKQVLKRLPNGEVKLGFQRVA